MAREIKIVVTRKSLKESASGADDRRYWLSRPSAERFEAVERLHTELHNEARLQRVVRIIKRARG